MSSNLKTALVAGTIALAVTIFAVGSAQAGGRHLPFAPYGGAYLPGTYGGDSDYDSYGCEDCDYDYGHEDGPASAVGRVTRDMLGVDLGDVVNEIAE
jgi:hypothetical protein